MRNLKKVLSLVLCMAMMLSIMVVGAGAAFSDQKEIKNTEAVDMCSALNIINGYTDGSFKPEGTITRAEACKMICVALNGGKEPVLGTNATASFTDIKGHWAEGYIEYCYSEGIVAGVGGGKFNPAGNVTGSQFAKMLLTALGFKADQEKFTGSAWEVNVNVKASQKDLYDELSTMDPSKALSRDNAAQMVWNTLQAKEVGYDYKLATDANGQLTSSLENYDKTYTMLTNKYNGEIFEGTLQKFTYDSNKDKWTYTVSNSTDGTNVTVKSAENFTDLYGMNVKAVYEKTTVASATKDGYGIFACDSAVVLSGVIGDLPKLATGDTSFKVDGVKYELSSTVAGTPVYYYQYNTTSAPATNLGVVAAGTGNVAYDAYEFNAVDDDDDGDVDFFMVYPYIVAKVTYCNKGDFKLAAVNGGAAQKLIADGVVDASSVAPFSAKDQIEDYDVYEGMAKDDYVVFYPAGNTADNTGLVEKIDLVAGKISAKDGNDLTIDGTVYTKDASYTAAVNAGDTMSDVIVVNGYIFDADNSTSKDITDYAVLLGADQSYDDTVKLLFSDGTKKVVTATTDYRSWTKGTLVTYDTNKDGEYTLTKADASNLRSTGFDYAATSTQYSADGGVLASVPGGSSAVTGKNASSSKAAYINGYTIADDAVIFVEDASGSYKVITGASLKTMAKGQFTGGVNYVLATDDSKVGVGSVNMAYLTSSASSILSGDTTYGYVTKVLETQNADKEAVLTVTIFTEDGAKTLETVKKTENITADPSKDLTDALKVGMVIEYTVDTDGCLDDIVKYQDFSVANSEAITGMNGDTYWLSSTGMKELDDDVVYLFIDSSEEEGADGYTAADIVVADKDDTGAYVKNAMVWLDGGKIVLVVYDVDNEVED